MIILNENNLTYIALTGIFLNLILSITISNIKRPIITIMTCISYIFLNLLISRLWHRYYFYGYNIFAHSVRKIYTKTTIYIHIFNGNT